MTPHTLSNSSCELAEKRRSAPAPISSFDGVVDALLSAGLLHAPPAPGLLAKVDQYEVLRPLGNGGMGVVLLALDPSEGKRVALKLLRPELVDRPELVRRFLAEARRLRQLDHPHITPVLALCERADMPYFTMPYFEQGSLAQRIIPGRPCAPGKIVSGARQAAAALAHAHRLGVLHRDIKPSNVLVDALDNLYLADFGLARSLFGAAEVGKCAGRWAGTATYLSPALAAGEPEDVPGDIYAFGALLYELLTGSPPCLGTTTQEILDQIRAAPPTPIRRLNPQAPLGLIQIAETAMARDRHGRYASMDSLSADLERVEHGLAPFVK